MFISVSHIGAGFIHPIEAVEDAGDILLGDADARILDGEEHLVPLSGGGHLHASPLGGVAHGVGGDVDDDLLDAVPVPQDPGGGRRQAEVQAEAMLGLEAYELNRHFSVTLMQLLEK